MNLQHIKYTVEVAEAGSINKAAEKLLIGQPSLSRAIKDLEGSLGIRIFERSAKGMTLTPEGETFMSYAKSILMQVDALETTFTKGLFVKKRFSASVPRASYISEAFARFSLLLDSEPDAEIFYKETSSSGAISNILQDDYGLGVIRYAADHDKYYKSTLEEKGLNYEMIAEFRYVLVMNKNCPLANYSKLSYEDLSEYTEIAHADPYVPAAPISEVKKDPLADRTRKKIFVFERGSQLELLATNTNTFMWVSPIPSETLERYGLVQCDPDENSRNYKDVLIYRKDRSLTRLDNLFIQELIRAKRDVIK